MSGSIAAPVVASWFCPPAVSIEGSCSERACFDGPSPENVRGLCRFCPMMGTGELNLERLAGTSERVLLLLIRLLGGSWQSIDVTS